MLQLGNLTFTSNLIQGPLAGTTCAPFRVVAHRYGTPAFCCSEMTSAKHLIHAKSPDRYVFKDEAEGPLCFQLSSKHVDDLSRATEMALELNVDLIDLNCGCPKPKMRKKGVGSRLLEDEQHLASLIKAIRTQTDKPVSIKIRVDGFSDDSFHITNAKIAEQAGCDFIIVHGRNWRDGYEVACHVEQVAHIVQSTNIPVIGNGDIKDTASAKRMLDMTKCAGLMICRASVGNPWLFDQIQTELSGKPFTLPTQATKNQALLEHLQGLIALEGEKAAMFQSRQFLKYYFVQEQREQHQAFFQQVCSLEDVVSYLQ
jgi:tRNA-dihydrouridine synthase B